MRKKKKKLETYNTSVRQKNKRIEEPEDERYCGNCCMFIEENVNGGGYCNHMEIPTSCASCCFDWDWLNSDDRGDDDLIMN